MGENFRETFKKKKLDLFISGSLSNLGFEMIQKLTFSLDNSFGGF
jgi:hypothetical protein